MNDLDDAHLELGARYGRLILRYHRLASAIMIAAGDGANPTELLAIVDDSLNEGDL